MRIDIKAGKETPTLTKAERDTLRKAQALSATIAKHCEDKDASTAYAALEAVCGRYCVEANGQAG